MKKLVCILCLFALIALTAMAQPLPEGVEPEMSVEQALPKMATYQEGESRLAESIVSDHVVKLEKAGDAKSVREFSYKLVSLLDMPDATRDGKRAAIRQIAKISGSEAAPALEKALQDEGLWDAALYALKNIRAGEADAALRRALESTSGRTRLGVIQTLGLRQNEAAVDSLIPLLGDKDATEQRTAARALARIDGPKAREALIAALDKTEGDAHREVADAALSLAQDLVAKGDLRPARKVYDRLHANSEPQAVRTAALVGLLSSSTGQGAVDVWKNALAGNAEARRVAIQWIPRLEGDAATKAIAEQLGGTDAGTRVFLISGLGERGDVSARTAVEPYVSAGEAEVRTAALEALQVLGNQHSLPVVTGALAAKDKETRDAARATLVRLEGDGIDTSILASMKSADSEARAALVGILAERGAKEKLPELLEIARSDADAKVRTAAVEALGNLSGYDQLGAVLGLLLNAKADGERTAAEDALVKIARQNEDAEKRAAPVLAAQSQAGGEAKVSLVRVLGRLEGKPAREALTGMATGGEGDAQTAAIRALADWSSPEPMDTLAGIAKDGKTNSHKVLALRGFIKQIGMKKASAAEKVALYKNAMQLATRDDERRQVLAGLGGVGHPDALTMIEEAGKNEALADEALTAGIEVLPKIADSHPAMVREFIKKHEGRLNRDTEREARRILRDIDAKEKKPE